MQYDAPLLQAVRNCNTMHALWQVCETKLLPHPRCCRAPFFFLMETLARLID